MVAVSVCWDFWLSAATVTLAPLMALPWGSTTVPPMFFLGEVVRHGRHREDLDGVEVLDLVVSDRIGLRELAVFSTRGRRDVQRAGPVLRGDDRVGYGDAGIRRHATEHGDAGLHLHIAEIPPVQRLRDDVRQGSVAEVVVENLDLVLLAFPVLLDAQSKRASTLGDGLGEWREPDALLVQFEHLQALETHPRHEEDLGALDWLVVFIGEDAADALLVGGAGRCPALCLHANGHAFVGVAARFLSLASEVIRGVVVVDRGAPFGARLRDQRIWITGEERDAKPDGGSQEQAEEDLDLCGHRTRGLKSCLWFAWFSTRTVTPVAARVSAVARGVSLSG